MKPGLARPDGPDRHAPKRKPSRRRGAVFALIADVLRTSRSEKKFWLAPLLLFLLILAALLGLISLAGPLATFVYPIM